MQVPSSQAILLNKDSQTKICKRVEFTFDTKVVNKFKNPRKMQKRHIVSASKGTPEWESRPVRISVAVTIIVMLGIGVVQWSPCWVIYSGPLESSF